MAPSAAERKAPGIRHCVCMQPSRRRRPTDHDGLYRPVEQHVIAKRGTLTSPSLTGGLTDERKEGRGEE